VGLLKLEKLLKIGDGNPSTIPCGHVSMNECYYDTTITITITTTGKATTVFTASTISVELLLLLNYYYYHHHHTH